MHTRAPAHARTPFRHLIPSCRLLVLLFRAQYTFEAYEAEFNKVNETAELRRLRCALDLGAPDRSDRPVSVAKKTSDDLRDVIENYAEIEAYAAAVEAAAPACPLAAMLRSTGFETFECDVDAALAAARWERAAAGRPDDLTPWKAHANETHPREADVFSSARDVQSGAPAEVALPGALLAPDGR